MTRIEANLAWPVTTGDPIKVGIIDSGIDPTHPELAANVKGGVTFVKGTKSYADDNGHGTHVAGTVAALDNAIGVVGVAPQADLYAIKVLSRRGTGKLSDVIKGLDWAVTNGMQVVNMSLGLPKYNEAFDLAVQRATAAGVVQVASAGNGGPADGTVEYPAKFPQVIAVGATDASDVVGVFSARGPEVAVCAPGVDITSTVPGGGYESWLGTSMAAPHVTGTVALMLAHPPTGAWDLDGDGLWDLTEVGGKLEGTATDLGPVGTDTAYGAGLIDAERATAP